MPRVNYCLPVDVLKRFDLSLEQSDIGATQSGGLQTSNDGDIFPASEDTILSHIEAVETMFERRAGKLTDQSTTELHEGIERDWGYTIYLDNDDVKSFDENLGDLVEVRTGPSNDDFQSIDADSVFLDGEDGVIEVNNLLLNRYNVYDVDDSNYRFRLTYRYGTNEEEGGETTLTSSVADTDTTPFDLDVDDASQIEEDSVVLLDATEYVYVDSRDIGADTLTVTERAIRGTTAASHGTGVTVNRIPLNVRDAIAAKVATRFLRQDDFTDTLTEGVGDNITNDTKIEQLDQEFEDTVALYTSNWSYV